MKSFSYDLWYIYIYSSRFRIILNKGSRNEKTTNLKQKENQVQDRSYSIYEKRLRNSADHEPDGLCLAKWLTLSSKIEIYNVDIVRDKPYYRSIQTAAGPKKKSWDKKKIQGLKKTNANGTNKNAEGTNNNCNYFVVCSFFFFLFLLVPSPSCSFPPSTRRFFSVAFLLHVCASSLRFLCSTLPLFCASSLLRFRFCASVSCASVSCASVSCASVSCASFSCASFSCASFSCAFFSYASFSLRFVFPALRSSPFRAWFFPPCAWFFLPALCSPLPPCASFHPSLRFVPLPLRFVHPSLLRFDSPSYASFFLTSFFSSLRFDFLSALRFSSLHIVFFFSPYASFWFTPYAWFFLLTTLEFFSPLRFVFFFPLALRFLFFSLPRLFSTFHLLVSSISLYLFYWVTNHLFLYYYYPRVIILLIRSS